MKFWWLLPALCLASSAASADIYKCRLPNGKTEISNVPCPSGSGTVTARPDETVPEASRQQAERDVERMRNYVEKREAVQRAETAAERQAIQQQAANAPARNYGDPDACLRDLNQQALEASQRAALEAECRSRIKPPADTPSTVYVPAYGGGNPIGLCIENAQRQHLSPAERNRRISQCETGYPVAPPHHIHPQPPPPAPVKPAEPAAPSIAICPPGAKNCRR